MIVENKNFSVLICIISSIFVVLKIYTGSNLFLWIFFLLTSTAMLLDKQQHRIDYLLFLFHGFMSLNLIYLAIHCLSYLVLSIFC